MKKKGLLIVSLLITALLLGSCSSITALFDNIPGVKVFLPTPQPAAVAVVPSSGSAPVTAGPESLAELQSAYTRVYEKVNPSVVNISVIVKSNNDFQSGFDLPSLPGLPAPFNQNPEGQDEGTPQSESTGSGFVWSKDGYIVTNNHVVDQAEKITIILSDGTRFEGSIKGRDPDSDLAVLKIETDRPLIPVELADSNKVEVGQMVIAIGNPYGLEGTMTTGIVSAIGRTLPVENGISGKASYLIPNIIQTDAPINPGNSGGVLVDLEGRLIGVTSAIESPVRGNTGVGFAIPSTIVEKVITALITEGTYKHPWIGFSGTSLTPELAKAMNIDEKQRGALVQQVLSGSPADKAGIKGSDRSTEIDGRKVNVGGDIITGINEQPVKEMDDLIAFLSSNTKVGQEITLSLIRDGKEKEVKLTLEARPVEKDNGTTAIDQGKKGQVRLGIQGLALNSEVAKALGLPSETRGVLVVEIESGSPADKANLKGGYKEVQIEERTIMAGGDIIIKVDGTSVKTIEELRSGLQKYSNGDEVSFTILRDGKEMEVKVTF